MTEIVIEAEDVSKSYGRQPALQGLSFTVERGSVLGLLGPNGAGKTTMIRIMSTIIRPDGGRVVVCGRDVVGQARHVRPLIGLAGQYAAVDEELTGRENLTMVGRLTHLSSAAARARAAELLADFGLADAADRQVRTYSGGMRRRLDLAAALVHRPSVLFLDEPTTGVDPIARRDLWRVIDGLVSGGTTLVLTTQYLEEADRLARQIVIIDKGVCLIDGTAKEVKARCGSTVLVLSFDDPAIAERAAGLLDGVTNRASTPMGTVAFEMPAPGGAEDLQRVVGTLTANGCAPQGVVLREPTLDDVFHKLVGGETPEKDQ